MSKEEKKIDTIDIPDLENVNQELYEEDDDTVEEVKKSDSVKKNSKKKRKKKKSVGRIILIIVLILLMILCLVVLAGIILFKHYYGKLQYDDGQATDMVTTEYVPEEDETPGSTENDTPEEVVLSVEEKMFLDMQDASVPLMFSEDVYNILLIGNDSRYKDTLGRSDSMIIVSINKKTEEIVMTSIMRDSYVYIPGYGSTRINAAYAFGGPDLLIETIETNFKIQIDNYVAVNFFSFMDAVDAVGGVEITVSDAEVRVLNNYVKELNRLEGLPDSTDMLPCGGTYHMNGKQALGYSRIRYVGNADYERTERQRRVLELMFNEMRSASLTEINDTLNVVLPEVRTDITEGEMFSLILGMTTDYKDYEVKQYRVPYDGNIQNLVINGAMVLGIDLQANINYMRRDIYGE